ncbi:MAG TPA: hypothetical protein VHK69_17640 [Chitinophagaceae bacterium]|jgi:uncharacterized membrane protein|nr:hypothetical protein [Chitinophagaceae bacterium]
MKRLFWPLAFLLVSCTDAGKGTPNVTDTASVSPRPDTTAALPAPPAGEGALPTQADSLHAQVANSGTSGIFRGRLGSAELTLALNENRTFRLQEGPANRPGPLTITAGRWQPTAGTTYLYRGQVLAGQFTTTGDTLLFRRGSDSVRLHRVPAAGENNAWRQKEKQGLEFFGIGNEPFWSIEVDEQQFIRFQLADWPVPLRFPAPSAMGKDTLHYRSASDSGTVEVTVYPEFCSDGMSDFVYHQRVRVVCLGKSYNGCGLLFRREQR